MLLWIEDNPTSEFRKMLQEPCKKKGLELVHAGGVQILHSELRKLAADENAIIKGIILDLMIHGVNTLSSYGYPDVSWDSPDAGEYLLKYVLRNKEPAQPELTKLKLYYAPVLILTVKNETRKEDFLKYGEKIELAHKYAPEDDLIFRNWINGI